LLALTTAGCDPIMGVTARVVAAPTTAASARSPAFDLRAAVPDASLSLACPAKGQGKESDKPLARTDAEGRAQWVTVGLWPPDCSIAVKADGYYDESFSLAELCPPDSSECHFVSVQAELAPKAGESPRAAAAIAPGVAAASSKQVRFATDGSDLTVLKLMGKNGRLQAWEPVCRPPCEAAISADDKLAVSRGDGPPVEPQVPLGPAPQSRVTVHYENRTTARRVWGVGALTAFVGGLVMVGFGAPGDNQPWPTDKVALTIGGFALLAGSALALLHGAQMVDTVELTRE
jgi:hypothetical protein